MKGKTRITDDLDKEIRNLYLPQGTSQTIVLPWKDMNENKLAGKTSPLKYGEDIVQEEETSIEATQLKCNEDIVQEEDIETQGSEEVKASTEPSRNWAVPPERDQQQGTCSSSRKRRPPTKLSKDFL
jgi:hypothetical protein